jgi:hypothetical protein
MATDHRLPVERVIDARELAELRKNEIEAILEVGYLGIACDRKLHDDELEAFAHVAYKLGAGPGDAQNGARRDVMDELLERFATHLDREGTDGRLDACAAALASGASRRVAYKVACALALSDMDAADREFEFDLALIAALGLTQDEADSLASDVHEAFSGEGPASASG